MVSLLRSLTNGKKSILNSELLDNSEEHNLKSADITAKTARKMFVLKMLKPPNVERKFLVEQNISTKAVYELPFKVSMENKLRCFQYKVVHNILPTNSNLYNMKLRTSPSCDCCSHPHENLVHLLYECPVIQIFWQSVISWWNEKRSENVTLRLLPTFAGALWEKNGTRASFNKIPTNCISVESLINLLYEKKI